MTSNRGIDNPQTEEPIVKIYVASSWRNPHQPEVVETLRGWDHEVYDFRNPTGKDTGFHWSEIDPDWQQWTPKEYREALKHPLAQTGFGSDEFGLEWCDFCLLVQPCGASAHLELGWAIGTGKGSAIYFPDGVRVEPELMPLFADIILIGKTDLESMLA